VTCSVQSTYLTGLLPRDHGAVGNGWYFRDLSEIWLWRQSNRLVTGERIWDAGKRMDSTFTCANLFWWYNMYSTADFTVTPRPMYPADGRKLPDIYTQPAGLREELNARLGTFPLFRFWGPATDISATQWIAKAARYVYDRYRPTLTLVYLPHLDYVLQRVGPKDRAIERDLHELDDVCGELIALGERDGASVVVLSEYGITQVTGAVHINRELRRDGWLRVREELGRELLDAGASDAFAVADHQVAHVYVARSELLGPVAECIAALEGVDRVLDSRGKRECGLDHERSGDLVAVSRADRWFSYYYWLDDERAPDFARTVDIHRKPGYDPVELFFDPALTMVKARVGWRLLQKAMGFRTLMDVIPLDATLVRGSHGRITDDADEGPLLLSSDPELLPAGTVGASDIKAIALASIFGRRSDAREVALKSTG
jgi:predicted AlkP superfamily pyrophosphatase or phosphodiesterase